MKQFWRFLLRKSLPPDSLQSTRYAVFGLGDSGSSLWAICTPNSTSCSASLTSQRPAYKPGWPANQLCQPCAGYVNFNTVAKKLDRRLAALGGCAIMERGLGDDQHPSGYEAALDPWLRQLWAQLRLQHPLPYGINDVRHLLHYWRLCPNQSSHASLQRVH